MSRVLIVDGDNYDWDACALVLRDSLVAAGHDVELLANRPRLGDGILADRDVVVVGSGFTRRIGAFGDPATHYVPDFAEGELSGILDFVRAGGGFVGLHATGWFIGGEPLQLIGGHANSHPPRPETTLQTIHLVDQTHPVLAGLADFDLKDDECYLSAYSPDVKVLATTGWGGKQWPMAWVHTYGAGRVFYSPLGHAPVTFHTEPFKRLLDNAVTWVTQPPAKEDHARLHN